jgi:hypothetical protein
MEAKDLDEILHGILCFKKVKTIFNLKDLNKNESDISSLKLDITLKIKKTLEWVLENPEFDYKTLLDSSYSNEELLRFFKIYYEDVLFKLDRYFNGHYIIKPSDFNN